MTRFILLIFPLDCCVRVNSTPDRLFSHTPFKKSNATRLWSIIIYLFYPGFVFIKLDIPGKPVYLPFDWCLICSDCFTEACVELVNWGQWQIGRVAKLIGFYGKCVLCLVSCFPFVIVCTRTHCARAHSLYRNPPKPKHHAEFQIGMQFWNIKFLDIASNIITLRRFLTDNHNK